MLNLGFSKTWQENCTSPEWEKNHIRTPDIWITKAWSHINMLVTNSFRDSHQLWSAAHPFVTDCIPWWSTITELSILQRQFCWKWCVRQLDRSELLRLWVIRSWNRLVTWFSQSFFRPIIGSWINTPEASSDSETGISTQNNPTFRHRNGHLRSYPKESLEFLQFQISKKKKKIKIKIASRGLFHNDLRKTLAKDNSAACDVSIFEVETMGWEK
jgi:hypothetical protein